MVKPLFVFFTLLLKIRFTVKGHVGLGGKRTRATQGFISLKMGSISHRDFQGEIVIFDLIIEHATLEREKKVCRKLQGPKAR